MIHLDTLSKRVLIIAISLSLVLLSLSAFVSTISRATAQQPNSQTSIIGMGVDESWVYYARWDTSINSYKLRRIIKNRSETGNVPIK